MAKRGILSSIFTNIFLAALIIGLYHSTQPGSMAIAVSAPVYRGTGEGIALQFAVSWNAAALDDIIDTLQEENVTATFAVSGEWAENNPAMLLRMAAEGHEIATMGYYPGMDGRQSWVMEDIQRANSTIERLSGIRPTLYYFGSRSPEVSAQAAKKLGMVMVDCTIDMLCAKGMAADIANRVPEEPIPGSIMLLQPTAACGGALPGILSAIEQKGYSATYTGCVLGR